MVSPVEYHGSAHISAFSKATGIITLPEGKKSVEKGEIVSVTTDITEILIICGYRLQTGVI